MARLLTNGFELQSVTATVELASISVGAGDTFAIDTSVKRGGAASVLAVAATDAGYGVGSNDHIALSSERTFYYKFDVYLNSAPSALTHIFTVGIGSTDTIRVRLNTDRTIAIYNGAADAVGSASSAIPTEEWHRVEVSLSFSGSVVAKLDGTQFATGSVTGAAVTHVRFGVGILTADGGAGSVNFDNICVNDDTGSYQNTFVGDTIVALMKPDSAGSHNQWLDTAGGAGDTTDWGLVDEIPANDGTDLIKTNTLNDQDYFNMAASGLGNLDTINVVMGMVRYSSSSDTNSAFKVQMKKGSGGTVAQGTAITTSGTTWYTNKATSPYTPTLLTYLDPDSSAWTLENLDSVQLGVILTTSTAGLVQVSGLYLMVDYTPSAYTRADRTATAKSAVRIGGITKTITAKSNVFDVPQLTTPVAGATDIAIPVEFVWDIPMYSNVVQGTPMSESYVGFVLQVDDTDNTFNSIEVELNSWQDSGFEWYFNSITTGWETYPASGIDQLMYYGQNADDGRVRVTVSLTGGTKYWRVKCYWLQAIVS